MIRQTYYYIQRQTEPCRNLAVERYLLEHVPPDSCVLYLWQNRKTVVIGRNQNAWQECRLRQLESDGGTMVRRLSGGGAVYHDLGNLNFTFLLHKADYDVARQLDVILQGLLRLGVAAEKSGRNDLTVMGRKFSGNAFYEAGDHCYHHGTLMVQVDRIELGKYLQVSAEKLASKGVASVQSRVVNLAEVKPGLTITALCQALIDALGVVYGLAAQPYPTEWLAEDAIFIFQKEFASDTWRFGQRIPFTWEVAHRFVWGDVQIQCKANYGQLEQVCIYSDAMDANLIEQMEEQLTGCAFRAGAMVDRLRQLGARQEIEEVCQYLLAQDI